MRLVERPVLRQLREERVPGVLVDGAPVAAGSASQVEKARHALGLTIGPPLEGQAEGSRARVSLAGEREAVGAALVGPNGTCALLLQFANA